jgi:two-component system cell cycle sensor histidine kinase/response regulator CckA
VNILIVDDSATIRDRLREMVSILPGVHRVDTAATASDASGYLESATPELVVLDIHLSGGSGIEVLDALGPARDRVTVIVLTNDPTPQTRDACRRAGVDFFFDKSAEFQRAVDVIAGMARPRPAPRDQLQLEQELLQVHRMEAVGRLAGGIAHDFNNLLTVIVGFSEDIIERLPSDDPTHADAVQIFNAGRYAVDLTRQLLAFSRKQILAPRVLDLNAVISQLAPILRRLIGKDVELVIRAAQDLGAVKADPGQLEQVLVNLVVNARDAMPQGGTLTIETSTAVRDAGDGESPGPVPGHSVLLTISDTGHGMDALTKAQIFEPFFTTREAGKGTGLGLSTVYGIVKQSGGSIFVDSEPGNGTTFWLYFPSRPVDEIEPGPDVQALGRLDEGVESILLVDDDSGVCEFTRRVLAARGYAVLSASSAVEALQLCDAYPGNIDLLLTDVVMASMTGPALADVLRDRYPGIKVVYMSGYATDAIDQRVFDPLVVFIAKPFGAQDLTAKIRAALDAPQS